MMMSMSNVNDILNMRWVSNDNLSPKDKKKMDGMHKNPILQALRVNLLAEQRLLVVLGRSWDIPFMKPHRIDMMSCPKM